MWQRNLQLLYHKHFKIIT